MRYTYEKFIHMLPPARGQRRTLHDLNEQIFFLFVVIFAKYFRNLPKCFLNIVHLFQMTEEDSQKTSWMIYPLGVKIHRSKQSFSNLAVEGWFSLRVASELMLRNPGLIPRGDGAPVLQCLNALSATEH